MDTEKQRQCRYGDARLTKSRNARSEQLLMMPTESLTNREWLPGELLSGLERQSPGWFLDMKYLSCIIHRSVFNDRYFDSIIGHASVMPKH